MIQPVNGHLIIEPVVHESFTASSKETYDEVGIVVENSSPDQAPVGSRVYFDSWLAAKFPKGDSFFWLVNWSDVRAIETDETLPE